MARINPVSVNKSSPELKQAFANHEKAFSTRITNMKATLGHSLLAFEVYMQWYPLYAEVKKILGERLAPLFAWSISYASDCPLCSVYFRKIIIDRGESLDQLALTQEEQEVLDFGAAIAKNLGHIENEVYNKLSKRYSDEEMVLLIAFAGQMIATNIFNNVIETEIDDYLSDYLPKSFSSK